MSKLFQKRGHFSRGNIIQQRTLSIRKYGNLVDKLADYNEQADLTKESKQSLR